MCDYIENTISSSTQSNPDYASNDSGVGSSGSDSHNGPDLFELADDLSLPDGGITNSHIDANGDGDIGIDTSVGETSAEESSKSSRRGRSEYGTNHLVRRPGRSDAPEATNSGRTPSYNGATQGIYNRLVDSNSSFVNVRNDSNMMWLSRVLLTQISRRTCMTNHAMGYHTFNCDKEAPYNSDSGWLGSLTFSGRRSPKLSTCSDSNRWS